MPRPFRRSRRLLGAAAALFLSACATGRTTHHRASVVQFLYPEGRAAQDTATLSTLRLPLKVGIAFVPSGTPNTGRGHPLARGPEETDIPEAERLRLARRITDHFRARPFVKAVELIPTSYLTPGGGYENLDQLRGMFDVDVMVLLSYDQAQFTGQGAASLTYLTLVGAYVVEGEKNDTRTMMDAVVLDVASRRMLFRAPGVSTLKQGATPVNLDEALRADRLKGYQLAADDLVKNLDEQLTAFRDRVKDSPEEIQVQRTAEYDRRVLSTGGRGAGAVDPVTLGLVLAVAATGMAASRRRRR